MFGQPIQQSVGSIGYKYGCQSFSWSAEQGKLCFSCCRSRLRISPLETGSTIPSFPIPARVRQLVSRETDSAVSFRVSALILRAQAEFGAYSWVFLLSATASIYNTANRHRVSPEFIGHAIACRRDVYRRESADTKPLVLKLARVTGTAYSGNPHGPFFMRLLSFPHLLLVKRGHVRYRQIAYWRQWATKEAQLTMLYK